MITVFSCSNKRQSKIQLFDELYFNLKDGEALAEIDTEVLQKYNAYFNNLDAVQIPLFKYIKNNTYEIFIGLPVGVETTQLLSSKQLKIRSLNTKYVFEGDSSFYSFRYHLEQSAACLEEYFNRPTETSFIYMAAITYRNTQDEGVLCDLELFKRLTNKRH
jgi:hypothetical protein